MISYGNGSNWDIRFLELAKHVSEWSKDPSTKVGAVIVNPETKQVVSLGYNGFPRGVMDTEERLTNRDIKYKLVCHAELNAILNATASIKGCEIYVYPTIMKPAACPECSKAIVQSGIKTLVYYKTDKVEPRWAELSKFSEILLREGKVNCVEVE